MIVSPVSQMEDHLFKQNELRMNESSDRHLHLQLANELTLWEIIPCESRDFLSLIQANHNIVGGNILNFKILWFEAKNHHHHHHVTE